ncbi:MAG: hypothetical protein FWD47_12630 [Treponema sp.]|nr:hypothetical protein [Treponema sp.]
MGIYDDERSGTYDNTFNRNFYKTKDRRGYVEKTSDEDVEKNIDSLMDKMEKKIKGQPFSEKINFLMDVVHNNITYDYKLNDFYLKNKHNKGFYNYKNSAKQVIKSRQGTCIGFANTFKVLCEGSGIECKTMSYKNEKRKIYHRLNIVFDNGKQYYVDPTWGFIVDNYDELKAIYRGEKQNPRTNSNVYFVRSKDYELLESKTEKRKIIDWKVIMFFLVPVICGILFLILLLK